MYSEIASFCSGILASVLQNELEDFAHKQIEDKKRQNIEIKTLKNIEKQIKNLLEQECIKDWVFKHQQDMKQNGYLFNEEQKEKFVEEFFLQHKELNYIHSPNIENIIREYLDDLNKWFDNLLSLEEKCVIQSIKEGQIQQSNRVTKQIALSTQEITNKLEELKNKDNKEIQNTNELFAKNYMEKKECCGYGDRKGKCRNLILLGTELCIECSKLKYFNKIERLYKIQNYLITKENEYFYAEQKSGIIKSRALVVPLYSENEKISSDTEYYLMLNLNKFIMNKEHQWIHIVTNGIFDEKIRETIFSYRDKVQILSEQDIIDGIMDFSDYLHETIENYENSILYNHYIDVYDENSNDLLEHSVFDFLIRNEENGYLILGDYGCGKTSFLLNLAYNLSKDYLQGNSEYIPLVIPLKNYAKSINFDNLFLDLFVNKCHMTNVSIDAFKMLLRFKKFVILFDGFDEVAKRVNYDVKFEIFNEICKYCLGKTKIIITCRPNYFQEKREYKELIENAHLQFEPDACNNVSFEETYIAELNENQIQNYIETFEEELRKNNLTSLNLNYLIHNTHDLMDLSKRPFLLNIIVQTLPQLAEEIKKDDKEKIKINAASLYKRYTDIWLDRENSKGKTLIRKKDKLHFCIHLAYMLFNNDVLYLHYSEFPKEIKEYFGNLDKMDEIDYFSHDIQSCSFMNSDGEGYFKFIHKSFMEYFVACYIADGLRELNKGNIDIDEVLSVRGISAEIAMFINDILEENSKIYEDIVAILEENINNDDEVVKQNIVTILSKMKYNIKRIIMDNKSYVEGDFSHSVVENAIIKNADFSNATFYGANIRNVSFKNCLFLDTFFQKATLENVDFSGQTLSHADFSYCYLKRCNFSCSTLVQADISQAEISESDFNDCDMSGIESVGTRYISNYNLENTIGIPYDMK